MKKLLLFTMVLLLITTVFQPVYGAEEASQREVDHEALRGLRQKAVDAFNSLDIDTLASCMAREFVFTTIDGTVLTNKDSMKAFYSSMFEGENAPLVSIETEPEASILTRFIDGNTGLNYGTAKETYTLKDGSEVTLQSNWTTTVVREGGEWRISAIHVGVNVLENPILAKVVSAGKRTAVLAGLAGLIGGFVISLVVRRKTRRSEIATS